MSLEIGPLNPYPSVAARPAARQAERSSGPAFEPVRDSAELSLPALPPPAVLDEVGAAADRVDELRASNRELHFRTDEQTGRVIVEVRDLDGNVIRTIPPSHALDVMGGAPI